MTSRLYYIIALIFIPLTCESQDGTAGSSGNKSTGNHVYISGETNINCFECRYNKKADDKHDLNILSSFGKVSGEKIDTYIPVSEFKCSNVHMYNDFLKLLHAGDYPYIKIELDHSQVKNIQPGKSSVDLNVSITIDNITEVKPISCLINNPGNDTMSITGETTVDLVDFNLKPPVKFMGLIKVRDKVRIDFSFNFNLV